MQEGANDSRRTTYPSPFNKVFQGSRYKIKVDLGPDMFGNSYYFG